MTVGRGNPLQSLLGESGVGPFEYDQSVSLRALVLETKRDEILDIVQQHKGRSAYLFGSVARGEETSTSDVDVLIEFEQGSSLFDLMHIEEELAALLGVSVDVVSTGGLKERDEHIRREAVPI